VVDLNIAFNFRVDTTGVLLETVSDLNTTGNWSVFGKIGLHLISTLETVVVLYIVVLVVNGPAFILAVVCRVSRAWWPGAVLAFEDVIAHAWDRHWHRVLGDVLLA